MSVRLSRQLLGVLLAAGVVLVVVVAAVASVTVHGIQDGYDGVV